MEMDNDHDLNVPDPEFEDALREIVDFYVDRNYDYLYLKSRIEQALDDQRAAGEKLLFVGSSHGLSGIMEECFVNASNLSMHSQDLYYDFLLTKNVVDACHVLPKICFIVMGYYIPYQDLSLQKLTREILITPIYYPLLNDSHHWEEPMHWDFWGGELPDEEIRWVTETMARLRMRQRTCYYEEGRERKSIWVPLDEKWSDYDDAKKDALGQGRAEQHNSLLKWTDAYRENKEIFRDYIHYLTMKGIIPVVLVTPYTKEYRRYLAPEYLTDFYEILSAAEEEVHLVDFNDPGMCENFNDADYTDMDHLNRGGAMKLSSFVAYMQREQF